MTLGELLSLQAAQHPDRPALLAEPRSYTWGELDAEVDRFAALLLSVGVGFGDAVGLLITKRPEVVVGFLACARLGAIAAPINFKLHADHVRDQLNTADIRCVLVERRFDGLLQQLLGELTDPRRIIYVGERGHYGATDYAEAAGPLVVPRAPGPDDPCYYNYTSGTTGRPKGAIATHRNVVVNGLTAFDRIEDGQAIDGLGFTERHVFLGMFSVFAHPHELFHRSLLCGGPFVIVDSLSPRVIGEAIERHRVSWMMAVPSFYEMLIDHVAEGPIDLSSLEVLESGGAFVGAETLQRMEEAFGAHFMPVWGSTETSGVAIAMRPDRPRRPGSTGTPVAGYTLRVVDAHGRELPPGEVGELLVRGEAVVSSYVNNPEETALLFSEGWYHTRDLVRCAEDGFIEFVGRSSEMLKIGGIRVYPLEIERVIKAHPAVREVVVVRAEERIRGEIPRAVIERAPGASLDAKELRRYLNGRLEVYKMPRIVEFWDEIPRLPNGKVDKAAVLATPIQAGRDDA